MGVFLARLNHLFEYRIPRERVYSTSLKLCEILQAIRFRQKNAGTSFTDRLKNGQCVFEEAGVEDGKLELNMTKVTRTVLEFLLTSRTF